MTRDWGAAILAAAALLIVGALVVVGEMEIQRGRSRWLG